MKIAINNFTTFSLEPIKKEILSYNFCVKITNKYFNYENNNIEIGTIELNNMILNIERILKNKLESSKRLEFDNKQMAIMLFPTVQDNRTVIDWQFFLTNDEGDIVSSYILTFEREDIIVLYMYLCKLVDRPNQFDLPKDYQYMYLYVRYLDVDTFKQFCYISDDSSIRIGDYVLVDRAGETSLAIVEEIGFYSEAEAPYPVNKTKEIIRRIERSELKNSEDEYIDDEDSYVTLKEFEEFKKDLDSLKDILKNQTEKLSIKELMRQILRDNIYSQVYYYTKLNIFIEKIDTIYFISKYQRKIFSTQEYKKMIKESVTINCSRTDDIIDTYYKAKSICDENNIEYIDDFNYAITKIECELTKILYNQEDKSNDNLYRYWCEKMYHNLKVYVRDSDMLVRTQKIYQKNIGQVIKEDAFVDCTSKIGGMTKNTRTFLISNHIKDLSIFERETNWGISVANQDSLFKILDVGKIEDKNYIILLHISDEISTTIDKIHTNIDDFIIKKCKEILTKSIKEKPLPELDESWYERLFFPVGINKDGKIQKRNKEN